MASRSGAEPPPTPPPPLAEDGSAPFFSFSLFLSFLVFFTAVAVTSAPISPQLFATNVGAIYAYGALICPMEEITRRRSSMHNFLSGAILGYAGVASQRIGIPFNLELAFHVNRIPLPIGGALVYGGIGMAIALFQGKPL